MNEEIGKKKAKKNSSASENLNRDDIDHAIKLFSSIKVLETLPQEKVKEIRKLGKTIARNTDEVANIKGYKFVDGTREKISTSKSEVRKSNMHIAATELYNSLSKLTENWYAVVDKIEQFPPTDGRFDLNLSFKLNQFKKTIDNINLYLRSLSDERYLFSLYEWAMIYIKENRQSEPFLNINTEVQKRLAKYYTGSRPKVQTTDKNGNVVYRAMTDKNKKYRLEQRNEEITELVNSIKAMSKQLRRIMYELSVWRDDKSEFKNAITRRIIDAHPKLSEKAFRYGGGMDQD